MTDYWHDLLQQQASLVNSFDLQSNDYFTALLHLGILQIVGDEAESFLQNLLTNDVAALELDQAQLNGFCNTKGRLFAIFILIRRAYGYQIILPKSMCDLLQQRLAMYILRTKVTISNESERLYCIGLVLTDLEQLEYIETVQHPIDNHRFLLICEQDHVKDLVRELAAHNLQLALQTLWQQLDIDAGLATIVPESKEKFTPQQVNLDLIGGVSFNKGCYPGQEVVARLHYLGKPSRRLFIANAATQQLPNIADEVMTIDGNIAGHIVSAQCVGQSLRLLISLKLTSERNKLHLNGVTITVQDWNIVDE